MLCRIINLQTTICFICMSLFGRMRHFFDSLQTAVMPVHLVKQITAWWFWIWSILNVIIISVLQTMFDYELELCCNSTQTSPLVSGGTYLLCLLISLSLPWSCCLFVCLFLRDNPTCSCCINGFKHRLLSWEEILRFVFHYITVQRKAPKSEVKVPHKISMA